MAHHVASSATPKQFVLCFDGTGNKFAGDESDSNVLKIFRMLDRSKPHQYHYYQPVSHVMGGYKFLMRYYSPVTRSSSLVLVEVHILLVLAEMLDYIGLLEAGNEELIRFAWKTFAKWQQRQGDSEEDQDEKKKLFEYMKAFRETFSRPITRIKFMGLFDTQVPYTARSSASVIRHAVAPERKEAQAPPTPPSYSHFDHLHMHRQDGSRKQQQKQSQQSQQPHDAHPDEVPAIRLNDDSASPQNEKPPAPLPTFENPGWGPNPGESYYHPHHLRAGSSNQGSENNAGEKPHRYRAPSPNRGQSPNPTLGLTVPNGNASCDDLTSIRSGQSGNLSIQVPSIAGDDESDDEEQDIHEVWFPGCHADIGGGWKLEGGELWALSHAPLVWMVQEAQKAGLELDERKMKQFQCLEEYDGDYTPIQETLGNRRGSRISRTRSAASRDFWHALHTSSTKGPKHDCLEFKQGLPTILLFLGESWSGCLSVGWISRLMGRGNLFVGRCRVADPNYRPGNIIVGGGGRGVKIAPTYLGMGEWEVLRMRAMVYVRHMCGKTKLPSARIYWCSNFSTSMSTNMPTDDLMI
ncbi:hypothetical protein N7466_009078 [Penicillium verhagenii]|uniref:uncharacterized protein n=1 Tax=Penicillium verhagenii TaxID=1562060 RepID=UPI0025456F95|nr:uncharacterized protein N7466_009078 [Penicillium verhagenii]KAJ5924891.1 hypothetical protein N7466_009078 [Penicillium verhagenii]